ncbi:MAG TPA: hypothetical protein VH309_03540, partial [Elusimicrobiota bacterium]|nr:hypothetical protein [Elusimicrobiota bacterium]
MKYWVYKDSRILGPFDKSDVAGLPGMDASTLVCAGEAAAAGEGDWRPAGDVTDLAALPLERGAAWSVDDLSSTFGLLDRLQLDAAGLIGDDEFPGAAEDLFQDADMKRTFGDLLAPRPGVDEAELRRAKARAEELTVQLELLYKRLAELETGQTNLVHRLAEKELELRSRPQPPADPALESFRREASAAAAPAAPAPDAPAVPSEAPPATTGFAADWPGPAGGGALPSFPSLASPPPAPPLPQPPAPPSAQQAAPVPPAPPAVSAPPASSPVPLDWAIAPPAPAAPESRP